MLTVALTLLSLPLYTREDVTIKLKDTPDGTFLVRNSNRNVGEYTLTVRKGSQNKLIRIICSGGKYGFSEPTSFTSVTGLIDYYQANSLAPYNPKLDVKLSHPISRFAAVSTWLCFFFHSSLLPNRRRERVKRRR